MSSPGKAVSHRLAYKMKHQINRYDVDDNGCWIHRNKPEDTGYVRLCRKGSDRKNTMISAHRLSYALYKDDVPADLNVLHTCDVRNCINPDHLFLGTDSDNQIDMLTKGRGRYMGKPTKRRTT